ncbi:thiol:disulfide interchange protein [Aggregicoccus sp. 17bor-14]|uniref:protein-disulfide reductase DsbD family protein n=1 Tax=Myxococcaceae TaxID=31 RepID=UPI00129C1D70|nr:MULTISPECIES: thioredoxin family protein [Myxococcaceae]MBF5046237.1 thioredoxin family protein [Simulacricoccus sp. 17bor-14]MRI91960.1 thiol:disulfide interchange protein [Aggregicoccus sp. 17bor-14]
MLVCLGAGGAQAAPVAAGATAEGAKDRGTYRVAAELLTDVSQVRAGDTFRVGVRFRLSPGWHMYWKNPGDSGLATEVAWDTPGTTVDALQWPFPSTFRTPDGFITTYGYADEVLLWASARASEQAQGGLTLSAAVDALVCEVQCLPAQLLLTRTLPVGPASAKDAQASALFDAAALGVPRPAAPAGFSVQVALEQKELTAGKPFSGTVTLAGPALPRAADAFAKDFFVPERIPGVAKLALAPTGTRGTFRLTGEAEPDAPKQAPRLRGVLRLGDARAPSLELDAPLAPVAAAAAGEAAAQAPAPVREVPLKVRPVLPAGSAGVAPGGAPLSLPLVLLFAFLGGALLNLMPCVFPVLALKAYGFSRMVQEERGRVGLHAGAYAGGILAAMLALALAVLGVRAAGRSVGWGFQFQEPLFVAAVAAVLVAFALNLFGVFHVGGAGGGLAEKVDASHGLARSAGEGVLAVVLATPCSAPLLGSAVGFALAAGPFTVLTVFLTLGLGLALPFCVLVLVPGLAKLLPRPGAWMERAKQLLGFALLATTVWLLWVMGGLAGVDGMARLAAFLTAVGLAAWLYGLAQGASGRRRLAGLLASALVVVSVGALSLRFAEGGERRGAGSAEGVAGRAAAWDEGAVAKALESGRPVFVDFTADWCLTCKFNERTVLQREDVQAAFARHKVALFVADWTRRDATIGQKLAAHGRAGVPMYLVLSPRAPHAPEVLPELLTADTVLEALARAAGPTAPGAGCAGPEKC